MRNIRASELGTYLFCQRAWWYWRQGYEPGNLEEMISGTELHFHHARLTWLSRSVRMLAIGLLVLAFVLGVLYFTGIAG
jgi:hypothetical protein